jgi:aspartyl-tRNA(Asn)/glutamyl-tRNA(Gln) amidotransferase subunit A
MLSHISPITTTALDSALLFDILKGPHWRDPQALPSDDCTYFDRAMQPLDSGLRVAFSASLFGASVDREVEWVIDQAIEKLRRRLDMPIVSVDLNWQSPFTAFENLWVVGRGVVYGDLVGEREDEVDPGFARLIAAARDRTPRDFLQALQLRSAFTETVNCSFLDFDILLVPTVPILPFAAEVDGPEDWDPLSGPVAWARWTPFTYPFNLTGQPAASMMCGATSDGLPVGLQVIGAQHDDAGVLNFCCAAERALAIDSALGTAPKS